jgi:anti-anti-sigma factor
VLQERPFVASYDAETGTLALSGILDDLSLAEMCAALDAATAAHTRDTVVDLSEVDFLPSMALGALATTLKGMRTAGCSFVITTAPGALAHRVLKISGLPFTVAA